MPHKIETLGEKDKENLIDVYKKISQSLIGKETDWFFVMEQKELENLFVSPNNKIFGYFMGNKLVGFLITKEAKEEKCFKKYYREEHVNVFQSVGVCPTARGNGIQEKLLKHGLKEIGTDKVIVATIHPDNWPSLNNFYKVGFKLYGETYLEGKENLIRFLVEFTGN